ncbi:MAG TPA: four helix bundle protein [Acidobacteriaceae bacterium]
MIWLERAQSLFHERMKTRQYRDLEVWQRSMELAQQIYSATTTFPRHEAFGMMSQMRRAAVSVPSNIAEGQGRGSDRSFAVFLKQARGSLYKLETQIELARRLGWLADEETAGLLRQTGDAGRLLNGLLRVLRPQTTSRGQTPSPAGSSPTAS